MSSQPNALIFDLDGTLVDSAPDLHTAVNRLMAEDNRRLLDYAELVRMVGDGVAVLVQRAYEATGRLPDQLDEAVERYKVLYGEALADKTVPFPGVKDTLAALAQAGHRMAVCTNKPYGPSVEILEALDLLRYFDAVAGGNSLPVRKPDAGHLLGVLDMLDADRDRAVMIGDSRNDVLVARNAKVPVIAVSYGYRREPVEALGADLVVDKFAELPAALRQFA